MTPIKRSGPKVFVSYSFGNPKAQFVAEALSEAGFQPKLLDDTSLLTSSSLRSSIESHIEDAEIVIPILDERASASNWCKMEIEHSILRGKLLLPLTDGVITPPAYLHDIPYLAIDRLNDGLNALLQHFYLACVDPRTPLDFDLSSYVRYVFAGRNFVRTIFDPYHYVGRLLERLDYHPPFCDDRAANSWLRESVKRQLLQIDEALDWIGEGIGSITSALIETMNAMDGYREKIAMSCIRRYLRLNFSVPLLRLATQIPPSHCQVWDEVCRESIQTNLNRVDGWKESVGRSEFRNLYDWAYSGDELPEYEVWFRCALDSGRGNGLQCWMPDIGDYRRCAYAGQPADAFVDIDVWCSFVIPQLMTRAVREATRFHDPTYISEADLFRSSYIRSGFP
jgi:hypothetical protein